MTEQEDIWVFPPGNLQFKNSRGVDSEERGRCGAPPLQVEGREPCEKGSSCQERGLRGSNVLREQQESKVKAASREEAGIVEDFF